MSEGPRVAESVLRAYARARPTMAEIRFVSGPTVLARPGESLLRIAEANQVPLDSGCQMGVCGADPVRILAGAENLTPPSMGERVTLRRLALSSDCRMACTARVRGPVSVAIARGGATPNTSVRADAAMMEPRHSSSRRRVVIIGNGVAGVTAAVELRERDPDVDIAILGAEPYDFYNRMVINKLLPESTAIDRLALLPSDWAVGREIRHLRGVTARSIDRVRCEVAIDGADTLPYDRLLLATGAACHLPAIEDCTKPGAFVMRTIDDVVRFREYIVERRCRRAVVVGAGLLGLEAASSIRETGIRVSIIETAAWPLSRQLDRTAGALVQQLMTDLGIKILPGVVARALLGADRVEEIQLADGQRLTADCVLLATGIEPNVELAQRAGLAVDHGVIVNDRMVTSDSRIFAAGDVAAYRGSISGLWLVAMEQARVAAINMLGGDCRYDIRIPPTRLKVPGLDVLSIGDVTCTDGNVQEICVDDDDPRQYRKLVLRTGKASAAIVVGHHALHELVSEAVMTNRDVSDVIPALRRGDWSVLHA
jgi:nitrite reductase (NADH) large subunit